MLQRAKQYSASALSSMTAIIVFMFVLPLTLVITLFILITGIAVMAARQYGLLKSGVNINRQEATDSTGHPAERNPQKAPIEGSYTVVDNSAASET